MATKPRKVLSFTRGFQGRGFRPAPQRLPQRLLEPERRGPVYQIAVPARHLVASTRQLATLFKAGIPIVQGIQVMAQQTEHRDMKRVLGLMHKDLLGGNPLSIALSRFPNVFPEIYFNSVAAAETGGVLDQVLLRLAAMLEREQEIARNVTSALRYPIMVLFTLVSAVIALMVLVVPQFAELYGRYDAALPLPTRVLLGMSHLVRHYWWACLLAVGAAVGWARAFLRTRKGRYLWDRTKLKLPIFGSLFLKMAMARFSSLLALLYANGVPILKALEAVSRAVGNAAVGREIGTVANSVREGKGLSGGMERSAYFTPLVRHMTAVGETSGSLQEILDSTSSYYDLEVRVLVGNLTGLIEPILTFGLAGAVLFLALAIYLPLWNLMVLFRT